MLKEKLLEDLKNAMKEKNELRKNVVQMARAAILQIEKDKKIEVTDEQIIEILAKEAKKRKDSLTDYEKSGREDLINQIKEEIEILEYMKDNISYDNKIEVVSELEQGYWTYVLTRYIQNKDKIYNGLSGQDTLTKKTLTVKENMENADYIVYFNRSRLYKNLEKRIHQLGDIIFENEYGGIIKCTNSIILKE